jgi:hypothetical protein
MEICKKLDLVHENLQDLLTDISKTNRVIRTNTVITNVLLLLLAIPLLVMGGCGVLAAASATKAQNALQVQPSDYADLEKALREALEGP